jgi:hypothetical protein
MNGVMVTWVCANDEVSKLGINIKSGWKGYVDHYYTELGDWGVGVSKTRVMAVVVFDQGNIVTLPIYCIRNIDR